jgi:hypothetical protein
VEIVLTLDDLLLVTILVLSVVIMRLQNKFYIKLDALHQPTTKVAICILQASQWLKTPADERG